MAFGFMINGQFLDLYDNSRVSFKKQNAALASYGADFVQDSYSLPVEIPLTDHNNRLLGWPGRIDSWNETIVSKECIFYAGEGQSVGIPMFEGRITVNSAGPYRASVFMVARGLSINKEKKFKDVDMGTFDASVPLDLREVAKDTTIHPLDYDFVFFPVWNNTFFPANDEIRTSFFQIGVEGIIYQNLYNNNHFLPVSEPLNYIITPFLRLEAVIIKVCERLGFTYVDRLFNDDEEMRLICLYNNVDINTPERRWPDLIEYNKHLPGEMGLVEFLRAISDNWWSGLVVDQYQKTISILPYDDILDQPHRWDWTDKILDDYNNEGDASQPSIVGYETDPTDTAMSDPILYVNTVFVENSDDIGFVSTPIDTYKYTYYVRDNTHYAGLNAGQIVGHFFKRRNTQGKGDPWLSRVVPLLSKFNGYRFITPYCEIGGRGKYVYSENGESLEFTNDMSQLRVTIYRGMRQLDGGTLFPYASSNAYDPTNEAETFDHSLLYDRANNMYEKRAARWIYAMEYKKIIKRRAHLRLSDITSIKEYDKIKIDGSFYLWREINLTFTSDGLIPAEMELWRLPVS